MVLACRTGRIGAATKPLPFETVAQFDLVLPSKRHGLRAILDSHAAGAGIDLKPRLELDTLPAICDVIASTDFVTILPTIALRQHLAAGKLRARRFVGPRIIRSIAWVHHPRRQVSVAAKAVLDIICGDLLQAATEARSHIRSA
jgi:DNA-binding transcriptional LysR family regulator